MPHRFDYSDRPNEAPAAVKHRCIVKMRDSEGVEHAVQVSASSLYEAVVLGLRHFRRSPWSRETAFGNAQLRVELWPAPTTYTVAVPHIEKWLKSSGTSPRDTLLRQKLRNLLNQ